MIDTPLFVEGDLKDRRRMGSFLLGLFLLCASSHVRGRFDTTSECDLSVLPRLCVGIDGDVRMFSNIREAYGGLCRAYGARRFMATVFPVLTRWANL